MNAFHRLRQGQGVRFLAGGLLLLSCAMIGLQAASTLQPIVHEQHNWRQGDVYSVADSFHSDGFDFLRPRVDFWRGPTGIVGMEAPIFPTLAHTAMYLFGQHPRAARLVSFGLCALAALTALLVLRPESLDHVRRRLRVVGTLAFLALSPMALFETRQIQADGTSLALSWLAVSMACLHSRRRRWGFFAAAVILMSLAVMAKSPALVAGPALWVLCFNQRPSTLQGAVLRGLLLTIPVLVGAAWFGWAAELTRRYEVLNPYFNLSFRLGEVTGNLGRLDSYAQVLGFLVGTYASSWVLAPAVVAGLVLGTRRGEGRLALPMLLWLLSSVFFCLAFAYRTTVHWYYALVVLPPVAYFGGLGLANLLELSDENADTGRRSVWAGAFVLLALLAAPFVGGKPAEGIAAPAADGAAFALTFYRPAGGYVLLGAAMLAALLAWRLSGRTLVRRPWALHLVVLLAFLLGLSRAANDTLESFRFRAGTADWWTFDERYRDMREAVDRLTTRQDLFVVDGYNPWYLHLTRRRGFSTDPGTAAGAGGLRYYTSKGIRYYLHFTENAPLEEALRGKEPLARGPSFELYCVDPSGACRAP